MNKEFAWENLLALKTKGEKNLLIRITTKAGKIFKGIYKWQTSEFIAIGPKYGLPNQYVLLSEVAAIKFC